MIAISSQSQTREIKYKYANRFYARDGEGEGETEVTTFDSKANVKKDIMEWRQKNKKGVQNSLE